MAKDQSRVLSGDRIGGSRTTDTMFDNAFGPKVTPGAEPAWNTPDYNAAWRIYNDSVSRRGGDNWNDATFPPVAPPVVSTKPNKNSGGNKPKNNGGGKPKKKNVIVRLINNFSAKPKKGSEWKISPGGYAYKTAPGSYQGKPGQAGIYKTDSGKAISYFNPSDGSPPSNFYGSGNAQTTYDNITG